MGIAALIVADEPSLHYVSETARRTPGKQKFTKIIETKRGPKKTVSPNKAELKRDSKIVTAKHITRHPKEVRQ